jgi:hypothetical protein
VTYVFYINIGSHFIECAVSIVEKITLNEEPLYLISKRPDTGKKTEKSVPQNQALIV